MRSQRRSNLCFYFAVKLRYQGTPCHFRWTCQTTRGPLTEGMLCGFPHHHQTRKRQGGWGGSDATTYRRLFGAMMIKCIPFCVGATLHDTTKSPRKNTTADPGNDDDQTAPPTPTAWRLHTEPPATQASRIAQPRDPMVPGP